MHTRDPGRFAGAKDLYRVPVFFENLDQLDGCIGRPPAVAQEVRRTDGNVGIQLFPIIVTASAWTLPN